MSTPILHLPHHHSAESGFEAVQVLQKKQFQLVEMVELTEMVEMVELTEKYQVMTYTLDALDIIRN